MIKQTYRDVKEELDEDHHYEIEIEAGKLTTDDVRYELWDTIKDDMEVETEPNVYEQYMIYMIYLLKLRLKRMLI